MVQPAALGVCVEIANGLSRAVARQVQYIHMPVPRDRGEGAFYRPLAGLDLRAGTVLYLGLVHDGDPEGNARKLAQADKFAAVSGIAAECCTMTNAKLAVSICRSLPRSSRTSRTIKSMVADFKKGVQNGC